jgi:hypothetical protein
VLKKKSPPSPRNLSMPKIVRYRLRDSRQPAQRRRILLKQPTSRMRHSDIEGRSYEQPMKMIDDSSLGPYQMVLIIMRMFRALFFRLFSFGPLFKKRLF